MPVFLFYHQSFHHVPDRPFQLLDVADVDFLEFDEMHFQMIRQNIMGIIIHDMIRVSIRLVLRELVEIQQIDGDDRTKVRI